MQKPLDFRKLPTLPKPVIRKEHSRLLGWHWKCSLLGAKLNIGYGATPESAYADWNRKHGTRELPPSAPVPKPRSFNSDDRL